MSSLYHLPRVVDVHVAVGQRSPLVVCSRQHALTVWSTRKKVRAQGIWNIMYRIPIQFIAWNSPPARPPRWACCCMSDEEIQIGFDFWPQTQVLGA